ncbi:MAG TPA: ATP-binding protein [Gemmata sp.]
MTIRSYPRRVLFITVTSCLLLAGLCGTVALALAREIDQTIAALGEDIDSRGAAINLEASLNNLAALHDHKAPDVDPLHDQIRTDLADIERLADKEQEARLARQVDEQFAEYLRRTRAPGAEPDALARFVRGSVVPPATALRDFNGRELRRSQEAHRRSLRQIVWGLAVVGGLGSVSGLVLGYGLARSLQRTIHQFLVRVQGATTRLGQEVPTVEWQRYGEPLRDSGDELIRRVEQVVQKLQAREQEVQRAERLAAVGQLAAGLAHEIRNPLTSVLLLLETSRRDPAAGGLTEDDLNLIESELHRIEKSLQLFLDYARPPKLERSRADLTAVVAAALGLVRGRSEQQRVTVRFEAPPGGCPIEADREQLRQVILNLILNALDVMPHGGTLAITVAPDPGSATIELTVADTGPGIKGDILPRLFEPFASGKETGLGLGLVVARRIVEDHGGTITGANRPEGGARFTVRLPAEVRAPE